MMGLPLIECLSVEIPQTTTTSNSLIITILLSSVLPLREEGRRKGREDRRKERRKEGRVKGGRVT